ncbi:uncharacterized protein PITG_11230 [Phytophthora infestans T30-4]|uniref:HTH myb-type domain-containing protein n=1 Tax=Phytophthora infestans (strain T30-4) TaxID=403677 RepID=D0NGH8_PHYIT|nr:uncharacterized protein PITG_11230 [Phytophthora infestans T30-4]EEY57379.1 hypothetical protein PITG_11230 [Phytophthora infestans T30-4]|eukprot:XP_002901989.1 hypothetical protein PITG_11230 [Phytophthora infestans T30-4]
MVDHPRAREVPRGYRAGPWKKIAHHIGTRSPRQVMTHAQKYRQRIKRHRKSRTESKAVSSTAGDSILEMMPAIDSPIAGQEEETLLEVLQLEPLPLLQPCESEISWQPSKEMLALDALLLDELEQLIAPAENILVEPASLNGDALMELVVDTSVDWTPVNFCVGSIMYYRLFVSFKPPPRRKFSRVKTIPDAPVGVWPGWR